MAKTESTAVNELISLVQGGTKAPDLDPGGDLFAEPKSTKVQPPRMTNTIPPMRGAGEVAPLPRGRAPQSTSQHSLAEQQQAAPVRMKTASPSRGTTIPPLARASTPPPTRASTPIPMRTTRPSLPPPRPSQQMPALRNTPRATLPPSAMPTASPFEAEPQGYPVVQRPPSVDMTADVIRGDNWFEVSAKVEKLHEETWVGRERQQSRRRELARMLVVPAIVAASVGVAIGVYISYRGGTKPTPHASTTPPITTHVEMPAPTPAKEVELPVTSTAPDPNSESHNAATASAGADQPQPPTKAEDAAKQQEAAALAAAHQDDPAAEPSLTQDAPATAAAHVATNGPAVQEIQTSHGVVKLVDVRIDSKPSGATVMLVDDGKTSFLGKTPLATSVDATKTYDVIFTLEGRSTETAHLDPSASAKLDVKLSRAHHEAKASPLGDVVDLQSAKPANVAKAATADVVDLQSQKPAKAEKSEAKAEKVEAEKPDVAVEKVAAGPAKQEVDDETPLAKGAKPAAKPAAVATKPVAVAKAAPAVAAKPEAKKPEPAKADKSKQSFDEEAELASLGLGSKKSGAKATGGEGTLMVSSKPPCEIYVDGKATGLTTPQKAIALPAGTHKITFVNSAESIKKTVSVSITADKSTKLIQDLMTK